MRQRGAVPATIAIMSGKVCIGLEDEQLEALARHGQSCTKVSRRDILPMLASKAMGATTVAATMLLANAAGIRVFVTGGIGGVHRGVQQTMDISADLTELGRTPVAVVCAGVKSVGFRGLHRLSVCMSVLAWGACCASHLLHACTVSFAHR